MALRRQGRVQSEKATGKIVNPFTYYLYHWGRG
jgi:hypothetical protein